MMMQAQGLVKRWLALACAALSMSGTMHAAVASDGQPHAAKVTKKKPAVARPATAPTAAPVVADEPLSDEQLALARQVDTGTLPCELGARVRLVADAAHPGYFDLEGQGYRYRLHPVPSRTGALRLEDVRRGAVWIQLASKSMLMDQKAGRRLADECMSERQLAVADAYRKNPPKHLLEPEQ